ncbi:TIR domain-containing protein [Streptomyces sp. NPDC094466]|uniref:TIR domain-containing protein n=1 Tax=Streptomyces sp. NPDC094466 TaxID=3366065 RepID=UPI00381C2456
MSRTKVFVSYARREFYFAEAVAATLEKRGGLDPWLDVYRLRPGVDWAAELDAGLQAADVLVLLASPTAMRSVYVRREWELAMERGIPVYVGIVAAVRLPAELARCPVVDLRGRVWRRMADLADAVVAERGTEGTSPVRRVVVAGPVLVTAILAVLTSVAMAWATVLLVQLGMEIARRSWNPWTVDDWTSEGSALEVLVTQAWQFRLFQLLAMTALAAPLVLAVLLSGVQLLRRRAGLGVLLVGFGAVTGIGVVLYGAAWYVVRPPDLGNAIANQYFDPLPAEIAAEGSLLRALLAGAMLCAAFGVATALWSRTVHLWQPTGAGLDLHRVRSFELRHGHRLSLLMRELLAHVGLDRRSGPRRPWDDADSSVIGRRTSDGSPPDVSGWLSVEVRCLAAADEGVARTVRRVCRTAGAVDGPEPWVLVLVSSRANWEATRQAVKEAGPRAICVLLDSVRLPPDSAELRRYQWLDFRRREPEALHHLLAELRSPRAVGERRPPTPIASSRYVAPARVIGFVVLCRSGAAAFVGFALVGLVLHPLAGRTMAVAVVTVPLVACLGRLTDRVARRCPTAAAFRRSCVLVCALAVAWSAVALLSFWTPASRGGRPRDLLPPGELLPYAGFIVFVPVFMGLFFYMFLLLSRSWLPVAGGELRGAAVAVGTTAGMGFVPVSGPCGAFMALGIEFATTYVVN